MFWGLIMEPGRCYTQTVKVSFHVSMAALDISNSSEEPAQVMCVFEGRNYLLCTLNKKDRLQCSLDLNFEAGSKVSFATNGKSHVHLTGYLTGLDDEQQEEEVEEEEESTTVTKKEKKRLTKELNEGPPKKKTKVAENNVATSVEEEEDSSDSDFDLDKALGENESEEEDENEEVEDEEDEEEEEASSLSEAESEEEEQPATKPKQNGVAKSTSTPINKKKKEQQQEKTPKEKPKKQEEKKDQSISKIKKTTLKNGVVVQDLKEGSGELVKSGKFVHVYYEGRLKEGGKMFDSTTKGPGFSFRVGKGEVIKGWDIGLVGMKVGGKRRVICPPNTAYGLKGSPPVIPPNATLLFDIELKKVN